jgi:hypothetical protein
MTACTSATQIGVGEVSDHAKIRVTTTDVLVPIGLTRPYRGLVVWSLAPLLALTLLPTAASGQSHMVFGGDVFVRSSYVWRGVTRGSGWVLQPDAFLSAIFPDLSATAGWWGTVELSSPDPTNPADTGLGQTWFGENDLWAEVAGRSRSVDFAGGITRYLFADGAFGQSADAVNTTELYAVSGLGLGPTVPRIALWYDVDRVRGAYVETSVDLRVPVLPSYDPIVALYLSTLAGWSVGQERNTGKPEEAAYFSAAGLTHVDLGLEAMVGLGQRYVTFELHFLFARDGGARPGASTSRGDSWWLGLGFSDSTNLGGL